MKVKEERFICPECDGEGKVRASYLGSFDDVEIDVECPLCKGKEYITFKQAKELPEMLLKVV